MRCMSERKQTQRGLVSVFGRLGLAVLAALAVWFVANAPRADAAKLGTRVLQKGSRGSDVRVLQRSLNRLTHPSKADGVFGPGTRTAVIGYETERRIPVDGIVQRGEGRAIRRSALKRPVAPPTANEVFPVPGPHTYPGPGGIFGAPRNGHLHQGQDVSAACNSKLVAAHGGIVSVNSFQASAAGYYIVIRSSLTGEDHVYMHLARPSWAAVGTTLTAGQQIGLVGATGDAVGCHLHFELWTVPGWQAGIPYDPLPTLQNWDAYS